MSFWNIFINSQIKQMKMVLNATILNRRSFLIYHFRRLWCSVSTFSCNSCIKKIRIAVDSLQSNCCCSTLWYSCTWSLVHLFQAILRRVHCVCEYTYWYSASYIRCMGKRSEVTTFTLSNTAKEWICCLQFVSIIKWSRDVFVCL